MTTIADALKRVRIGAPVSFKNLTMLPLLDGAAGEPDYLTLDEALASKQTRITEISEGGSVPDLKLFNDGDRKVLLIDGEELIGAKQNRILNLSILVPEQTTVNIPVSCVEAGRWAHASAEFAAAPQAHYAAGRAAKMRQVSHAMASMGSRHSDQGAVWQDIDEKAARMEAPSPTHAMSAIYERHGSGLEEYVSAFSAVDGQAGALFAIDGQIVGFDLFDYASTLRKLLPKLARSYALDALDSDSSGESGVDAGSVEEFLRNVAQAESRSFAALGVGEDVRFSRANLTGGALLAEDRLVHLSAFRLDERSSKMDDLNPTLMSRASSRRSHWQEPAA